MDVRRTEGARRRLSSEYESLIKLIARRRLSAEEINIESTEDEGDLASISHDRDLLYSLHEGGFARLRYIQEALKALDRGQYGICVRCLKSINPKRLEAVPWASMCVICQAETETEHSFSRVASGGQEAEDPDW